MKSKRMDLLRRYREIITYVFVGGITTLVNWAVYILLMGRTDLTVTASNSIAWAAAVVAAFFMNKVIVFRSRGWRPAQVLREAGLFVGSRILSGIVEVGTVPILLHLGMTQTLFGLEGGVAKIAASVLSVILSYILSKYAVFAGRKAVK